MQNSLTNQTRKAFIEKTQNWFQVNKVKAFYSLVDDMTFEEGSKALLQASGVGKLRPNILMMGFKNDWNTCNFEELKSYLTTIQ